MSLLFHSFLRRGLAVILAAAGLGLGACTQHQDPTEPPVTHATSGAPFLRAAHWFGGHWAVNFWNTDLESRAADDFAKIKSDEFNAVVLLVPWPGFTANLHDGSLVSERRDRLQRLIRMAADADLDVVLRLSYAWDAEATDAGQRLLAVWSDPVAHAAWLEFVGGVWDVAHDEPNVLFGFFSWEDLWAVMGYGDAELAERISAAEGTGFRAWLRESYTLDEIAERFRSDFRDWSEVPVPQRREPAFALFLTFVDQAWIERFFLPAQQRFPKMSMEIRIDSDPVWDGEELVSWHSHEAAWDLPGAPWTTIYWSPAMGGENRGEALSPEIAAERLDWMLGRIQAQTGARPIFIGQFLAEDFTPGYEKNGRIPREQVGRFLELAGDVLARRAGGYGLWTWIDYAHDAVGNPEFFRSASEWSLDGAASWEPGLLRLGQGGTASHRITLDEYHAPGGPTQAELCVHARSGEPGEDDLVVHDRESGIELARFDLDERVTTQCRRFDVQPDMTVSLAALREVELQRVGSKGFVQVSGMRDESGERKPIAASYVAVNQRLRFQPALRADQYADGWIGRSLILPDAAGPAPSVLRFRTHLPHDWPVSPRLSVQIDGRVIATVPCADDQVSEIALVRRDAASSGDVRIDVAPVHRPEGDDRSLGCLLRELRIEPGAGPSMGGTHASPGPPSASD